MKKFLLLSFFILCSYSFIFSQSIFPSMAAPFRENISTQEKFGYIITTDTSGVHFSTIGYKDKDQSFRELSYYSLYEMRQFLQANNNENWNIIRQLMEKYYPDIQTSTLKNNGHTSGVFLGLTANDSLSKITGVEIWFLKTPQNYNPTAIIEKFADERFINFAKDIISKLNYNHNIDTKNFYSDFYNLIAF